MENNRERVQLEYEHISKSEAKDLIAIWSDKEVIRYTNIKRPCTLEEIENRILIFKNQDVFIVKNNQKTIGIVGCPCINKEKSEFGLFYQLKRTVWGKGIGSKASKYIINYMKRKYGKLTIYADVVSENIASDKILNTLGFRLISEKKDGFKLDGRNMDIKNYYLIFV